MTSSATLSSVGGSFSPNIRAVRWLRASSNLVACSTGNAAGFAPSEPDTFCGYDKLGDDRSFLSTMVHEGAHLFHQLSSPSANTPSWVAEGMATYFEGFSLQDGGHLKWTHISQERHLAVKEAIRRDRLLSIAREMSPGRARSPLPFGERSRLATRRFASPQPRKRLRQSRRR